MADMDRELREIAAETYRSIARRARLQSSLLTAQAEAFEEAAALVESGAVDVDTLRLVPSREEPTEQSPAEVWQGRVERMLRTIVSVSYRPVVEMERATLVQLAEAAGFGDDESEARAVITELVEAELIEQHRVMKRPAQPIVVFVPTEKGYEEVGEEPVPPVRLSNGAFAVGHLPLPPAPLDAPVEERA